MPQILKCNGFFGRNFCCVVVSEQLVLYLWGNFAKEEVDHGRHFLEMIVTTTF